VFVDFDGTIASVDTTGPLLERLAAPAWRRETLHLAGAWLDIRERPQALSQAETEL
jgi:2-hydroxy-3-keto-5-methylthiopentenyl-1-phosphate phosphatase